LGRYTNTLKKRCSRKYEKKKKLKRGEKKLAIPFVPSGNRAFPRSIWPLRTCSKFIKLSNFLRTEHMGHLKEYINTYAHTYRMYIISIHGEKNKVRKEFKLPTNSKYV
jgi:hypothetical protein